MRRRLVSWLSAAAVLAVMLCPVASQARPAAPHPASPKPAAASPGTPEKHPEIRAAIRALETAKQHLQQGAHDFGGHRTKALEHVNQALEECHRALEFDKK